MVLPAAVAGNHPLAVVALWDWGMTAVKALVRDFLTPLAVAVVRLVQAYNHLLLHPAVLVVRP